MAKVTFSVDDGTVRALREIAQRLGKSQSMVVREAVAEYGARAGRLTEAERRRMLMAIDEISRSRATRPQSQADREIDDVRRARRAGGRRHSAE